MDQQPTYLTSTFDEIVFDGRNKRYGSFVLRSIIRRHTLVGLTLSALVVLILMAVYLIDFSRRPSIPPISFSSMEVTLSEPPPILEVLPPAVPPPMAPKTTQEIAELVVKQDADVTENNDLTTDSTPIDSTANGTATDGSTSNSVITGDGNKIYSNVEVWPEYPGGKKGLQKYLADNVEYPATAKKNGITGTVWVIFVVNEDGSVSDVKVEKGIGGGCDQEAVRVVEGMRKWKPGKQNGNPVRVYQRLKIGFALDENS
jgi:protein TonB